ncbi:MULTISPECIES: hypothetical protein [unclassified Novosphingobium]|uniref:ankyrin repeat domain-containing protein n=1 Tax=unclassified Novosphingobium TaxID=2644732 RepID=UPI00146F57EA|nr:MULTISPECIES: hypothetical protein [unclassified Novosphingobium]NMN03898.1 ankyrin repeat protein [Novosphingobium sp. SG919]NMN86112.1 ankyrin repeat protein [Novosphingobium sp. SG916]
MASPPLAAQELDPGIVVATLQAKAYPLGPDEQRITLTAAPASIYLIRLGARLNFLERYDRAGKPIWRSPPLRLGDCPSAEPGLVAEGLGASGEQVFVTSCPPDRLFFLTPTNDLALINLGHPADIMLLAGDADRLREALERSFLGHDLLDAQGREQSKSAGALQLAGLMPLSPDALAAAVATARSKPAPDETDFAALRELFAAVDFRRVGLSVRDENDLGYFLARAGGCADLADAIAVLRDTQRRARDRASAHLNLGDAYAALASSQCKRSTEGSTLAIEQYRHYCAALLPGQPPRRTLRRLIAWLRQSGAIQADMEALDAEFCRPRLRLFDDLASNDLTSLRVHIIEHREDLGERGAAGLTVLAEAIEAHNGPMVKELLEADALRFGYGDESFHPLQHAIFTGPDTLDAMLDRGAVDPDDKPLLTVARIGAFSVDAAARKVRMANSLLRHGADIRQADDEGGVIIAAAHGDGPSELFRLLREAGAPVNLPNRYGRNALFYVGPFDIGRTEATIASLRALGVAINQVDHDGMTPLSGLYRWTNANPDAILAGSRQLLEAGADPNLTGNAETALTKAAGMGWPKHVALLLAHGARLPDDTGAFEGALVERIRRQITDRDEFPESDGGGLRFAYRKVLALLGQPVPPPAANASAAKP